MRRSPNLQNLSDIRRFFYSNEIPLYFISDMNFNMMGADTWVRGFKFISYYDTYDSQHPNVFVPPPGSVPFKATLEEQNNELLKCKFVTDYIKGRGGDGKALFLMFDEETEDLAQHLGLQVCFPSAKLRRYLDSKVITTRIAEKAGVSSVPNVLGNVGSYEELRRMSAHLGQNLVVQTPYGDSGHTTYFISSEQDWSDCAEAITIETEVKVMKRVRCRSAAVEACVTRHGTLVAPILTELVGFPELTPFRGGWCGNEIFAGPFDEKVRRQAREATEAFGDQLREEGYLGYFELDFLIDEETHELYLGELNPRITGASSLTNHALFALMDVPLFLFHLLEWFDVDYDINVHELNERWSRPENIDSWSQLILMECNEQPGVLTRVPRSGIWKMSSQGDVYFDRYDVHRRSVDDESEAFFLRILDQNDYHYYGAELGILVTRGRLMTNEFTLTERAQRWIRGMYQQFESTRISEHAFATAELPIIGSPRLPG